MDLRHLRVLVYGPNGRLPALADLVQSLGAQVVPVDSSERAVARLARDGTELLLVDMSDEAAAYSLMERVRALPPHQGGRVAAASLGPGLLEGGRMGRWQGAGFQLHLVEPADPVELRAVLETLGGRSIERRRPGPERWRPVAVERRAAMA